MFDDHSFLHKRIQCIDWHLCLLINTDHITGLNSTDNNTQVHSLAPLPTSLPLSAYSAPLLATLDRQVDLYV